MQKKNVTFTKCAGLVLFCLLKNPFFNILSKLNFSCSTFKNTRRSLFKYFENSDGIVVKKKSL